MKKLIAGIPWLGTLARRAYWRLLEGRRPAQDGFSGSAAYWQQRYAAGGNSGVGSYERFAEFKAEVLNRFVAERGVHSVIEFGCGDGNQLALARYPDYHGFDVSQTAVANCRARFAGDPHKRFDLLPDYRGQQADLALSLDVIYHLVEDPVFEGHMQALFGAATRWVIVYSSDTDDPQAAQSPHVRQRQFTRWVAAHATGWRLVERVPNRYPYRGDYRTGSFADFFVFERQ